MAKSMTVGKRENEKKRIAKREAEKEEQQRHENVIPCPPLNPK